MKKITLIFYVAALLALSGCANSYKQFYHTSTGVTPEEISKMRASTPPEEPAVENGNFADLNKISDRYAEKGYSIIGSSFFNSGDTEPISSAVKFGAELHADLVVVMRPQHTGTINTSVPITNPTIQTSYTTGSATTNTMYGPVSTYGSATTTTYGTSTTYMPLTIDKFDYGAIYFIKQKFIFGAYYRNLEESERKLLQSNKGVYIRIVVEGSPAYKSDILPGDIVISVDGERIENRESMGMAIDSKVGKNIAISLFRDGSIIEKVITLNEL